MMVGGNNFNVTDAAVGLTSGIKVARIGKKLIVGDTLSKSDAYQCNYFGSSSWGDAQSIIFGDKCWKCKCLKGCKCPHKGRIATKIIFPSGQTHALPYDESEFMNNPITNYITCSNLIGVAQDNYIANPIPANFALMQAAYVKLDQSIQSRLALDLSERGKMNLHASMICAGLEPSNFGNVEWRIKRDNYDQWHLGYTFGPRSSFFPGWSNGQDFYEKPAGPDGDFGQGPYFYRKGSVDRMITVNKGGFLEVHDMTNNPPTQIFRKLVGNTAPIGASNYGSTMSGKYFMTIILQAYNPVDRNKGAPSPNNYPAVLRWYTSPTDFFDINQSFVLNFNAKTLQLEWQEPVLPNDTSPFSFTATFISSSKHLVYLPAVDGKLHIRDIKSSNQVAILDLDGVGGQSGAIILDDEIYVGLGRNNLAAYSPKYQPATFFYKFALPHHCKDTYYNKSHGKSDCDYSKPNKPQCDCKKQYYPVKQHYQQCYCKKQYYYQCYCNKQYYQQYYQKHCYQSQYNHQCGCGKQHNYY